MTLRGRLIRLERRGGRPNGCPACIGRPLSVVRWPSDAPCDRAGHVSGGPCTSCGRPPDREIEIVYVDRDEWRSLGT